MTALSRARLRVRQRRDPVLSLLTGVGSAARWLASRIPDRYIDRYSGMVGEEKQGNCTYDQMTTEQHQQAAEFWLPVWKD